MMKSFILLVAVAATMIGLGMSSVVVYGCQTNAIGCQKNAEPGTPASNSPPEVSGCHFFDTQSCVRESTPP